MRTPRTSIPPAPLAGVNETLSEPVTATVIYPLVNKHIGITAGTTTSLLPHDTALLPSVASVFYSGVSIVS